MWLAERQVWFVLADCAGTVAGTDPASKGVSGHDDDEKIDIAEIERAALS
jgi:hypothetical protein